MRRLPTQDGHLTRRINVPIACEQPVQYDVEKRREIVARTMGCLRHTHTSSQAFAQRKQEDKAKEERRWTA